MAQGLQNLTYWKRHPEGLTRRISIIKHEILRRYTPLNDIGFMKKFIFIGILSILLSACAEKRPIEHVLPEIHRLEKAGLTSSDYYFNTTVVGVSAENPISHIGDQMFGRESLIRFEFGEKNLTGYFVDPLYDDKTSLRVPVISFPVDGHVDVEREKNMDNEETHREIETTKERQWQDRRYAKINFSNAKLVPADLMRLKVYESFGCVQEVGSDLLDIAQDDESINLTLAKTYRTSLSGPCSFSEKTSDTFTLKLKMSFLKKTENPNFKKIKYTKRQQRKVGLFKTQVPHHDRFEYKREETYATHWDPSKKIVYYLSPDYPKKYRFLAQKAIDAWNETAKKIIEKPLLELRDNTGQELGDLRYNFIVWVDDPMEKAPGGFGPFQFDSFTGEIINANVFIFAGSYRQSIHFMLNLLEFHDEENKVAVNFKGDSEEGQLGTVQLSHLQEELTLAKQTLPSFFDKQQNPKTIEGALHKFEQQSGRCYYPTVANERISAWYAAGQSEEEMFQHMILDSLVHEIGHNLGLRHNFMGSVDKKHFSSETARTSSVMDYLDTNESENGKPGPYDEAALKFALTGEFDYFSGYKYCTDGDVLKDPFCNRFDVGTSATEIAVYLAKRYEKFFMLRNLRGMREHFKDTPEDVQQYISNLLQMYFLPLRSFVDYLVFLTKTSNTINADPLSLHEMEALRQDLLQASSLSLQFFRHILIDYSKPYQNIIHPYLGDDELGARGTRIDKILAATLISTRRIPVQPWAHHLGSYFDVVELQGDMLSLMKEITISQTVQPLISFLTVAQFIGEVPLIGQRPLSPMARSSLQASALFETNALPYTQENIDKLTTTSEDIEYVIDQDQGVIYTTRKDSLIAYMDEPPLVALFKQYKEKKKEFKTFLTDFSEQKNDSSPADLTQTIFKLEKIFTTKLNPLDLNTFKALPESDANLIETIMNRLIIINSSEKYIAVMERAKKEFPKQGLSTLRALLYQYSTDEPNDEALRSEINGLSEKDLFTRMNSVMKTLPKRKARVMQSKINNVSQRNSQVVGEIDRAIQILENTEDIFTLSEEVGTGLISFLSRLYSESIIVTNPQDLMNYIGNFTQVTVSRAFRYKEELNYLKLRIEFYNSLFESRGIQLR